ncbi:hypothetical protein [Sulfitobacter sp. MOLA879]|uniref:hypothetical protein n=1 Tax=Sulfitobacter sp. MOLA879 TaxID=3368579 RepID=UPI003746088C
MRIDTKELIAVDTRRAAEILGVSKSHLEKLRIDDPENSPPYFRIGKCVRYSVERLKEWSGRS